VTCGIEQDVLRLQVALKRLLVSLETLQLKNISYLPVDNVEFVQVLKSQYQLGDVESSPGLGESPFFLQMPEKLPSALVIGNEKEVIFRLKTKLEPYEEGRIQRLLQDLPFSDCVRYLFLGHYILLGKHLHSVDPLCVALPNLEDFSERSPTNQLEDLKVLGGKMNLALRHDIQMNSDLTKAL
jgi:hypothetical protein